MDDRIERHAEILVDHCTDVSTGDEVLIKAPTRAEDGFGALHERFGARPRTRWI